MTREKELTDAGQSARFNSLAEAIQHHAIVAPTGARIRILGSSPQELSYFDLWCQASAICEALELAEVGCGDRVAVSMATTAEVVAAVIAISIVGAVLVPIQPPVRLGTDDYLRQRTSAAISAASCSICLASQSENDALAGLMEAANCPILCIDSIAPITAHSVQPVDCSGDDLALIQFSSGSTGEPKGICLSRHNVASNINAILNRCEWTAKDVALSWLPLYHDLGLISATLSSLWAGSGLILYPPIAFVRNPIDWLKKASEYGATMSCAPQFAYSLCAAKVEIDSTVLRGLDFAPMRWFFNGSEFIHWDTCAQFERLLAPYGLRPNAVQPGYGLAENCVGVTLRTPLTPVKLIQVTRDQVPMMAGSADVRNVTLVGNGTPIDGTKIAIRSDEGADLPDGTIGHVYISGDATTSTYLRADGQSFKATVSGWLATGDLGIFVEEELFIVGRSKEIIKKGGRTISPPDVEASLVDSLRLPLGGVAVFSFHSEDGGGERIVVIVEVRRSQMENEMTDMLVKMKAHLARAFHFQVDAAYIGPRGCLLRTSSGKLRRGELANLAAAGTLRDKIGLRQLHSFKQATIENSC